MHVPVLLASSTFGDQFFLALFLLSVLSPPTIFWLRRQRWQFGIGFLMGVVFLCVLLCSFCARDLQRIDRIAVGCWHNPIWLLANVLLPAGVLAAVATWASVFLRAKLLQFRERYSNTESDGASDEQQEQ